MADGLDAKLRAILVAGSDPETPKTKRAHPGLQQAVPR